MHISISSAGEVRVTGLSDEEYRLAGYVEELDRFLNTHERDFLLGVNDHRFVINLSNFQFSHLLL